MCTMTATFKNVVDTISEHTSDIMTLIGFWMK